MGEAIELELGYMDNAKYIIMAAQHSRYNAGHWFRYLRKIINEYGVSISQETIEELCLNELLYSESKTSSNNLFNVFDSEQPLVERKVHFFSLIGIAGSSRIL